MYSQPEVPYLVQKYSFKSFTVSVNIYNLERLIFVLWGPGGFYVLKSVPSPAKIKFELASAIKLPKWLKRLLFLVTCDAEVPGIH